MTRVLSAFLSLILGTALLVSTGCEDEATKTALSTCRANIEGLEKTSTAQVASVNALKQELAQSQAKVQELTKEVDQLKNPKPGKAESTAARPASKAKKK